MGKSISWYTTQSPVHKLVNNLLRSCSHPSEIYYIQPFFKALFQAILCLFRQQQRKNDRSEFLCYRGGLISLQQLSQLRSSIGGTLQNLGFLSASLCEAMALNFAENAIFEINVPVEPAISELTYGFALVEQYSVFEEKEVIFNPMNSFKVVSI